MPTLAEVLIWYAVSTTILAGGALAVAVGVLIRRDNAQRTQPAPAKGAKAK